MRRNPPSGTSGSRRGAGWPPAQMKPAAAAALALLLGAGPCRAARLAGEPLGQALQLVGSLEASVRTGAEAEDRSHQDLAAWCEDAQKMAGSEVRALSQKKAELEALIAKTSSAADAAAARVEADASAEQTQAAEREHSGKLARKAELEQRQAQAEGELGATGKSLGGAQELLDAVRQSCGRASSDHGATAEARGALLSAIGVVKKTLSSATGGTSMLMLSKAGARSDPSAGRRAAEMISGLAHGRHHFSELSQLASNMEAVVRLGEYTGEDVFAKIRAMLTDMIARMQSQSAMEVTEKQFCDEQMAKNKAMRGDLEAEMAKRSGKMDEASAHAAQLAEDVKDAHSALALLAQSSARLLAIRQQGQANFAASKEALEGGLQGVRRSITALREYTAGGAEGPRAQLEEVESRVAMHLTALNLEADGLTSEGDALEQALSLAKATKEQDAKYLARERGGIERSLSETQADTGSTSEELDAVKKYQAQLHNKCVAQPDSYEERKRRREEEIAGLRDALAVLEGDALALAQTGGRGLRRQPLAAL